MSLTKLLLTLLIIYLLVKLSNWWKKRRRVIELIEKIPGPPNIPYAPIINHSLAVIYLDSLKHESGNGTIVYNTLLSLTHLFREEGICRFWNATQPVVMIFRPELAEQILSSTSVINKSSEYSFLQSWIGEGLITSGGNKWHYRRKILTPAFHFRIMSDFIPIMNKEASTFVRKLNSKKYIDGNKTIEIVTQVSLCTLDTICETAMGTNIDCQNNENAEYVLALKVVTESLLSRISHPWLWPRFLFERSQFYKDFKKNNDSMQEFTMGVIKERRDEWIKALKQHGAKFDDAGLLIPTQSQSNRINENEDKTKPAADTSDESQFDEKVASTFFKSGKKLAFLDLMIYQHLTKNTINLKGIQEEVDTFMFAGHDTTAMNISYAIYMLGLMKNIQDKVRAEIDEVLGDARGEICENPQEGLASELKVDDISVDQLNKMEYLDRVIKETLRMWPSVPFVGRIITEEVTIANKYTLPIDSTCMIFTHAMHNNPVVFPKPHVFDPDRFLLENTKNRHPYAFVPFSAGPRNCIGQKYAKMEVKIILAKLIRNYYIKTCDQIDTVNFVGELVLRPVKGLHVQLIPRFKANSDDGAETATLKVV